ncbi:MAG: TetR/AcrR family transcriptional regulator [Deltaproteobacteria bacterium]|nr:TetR/AcrR family transcriptional regulator [Deltaproteobacteria bacterium]
MSSTTAAQAGSRTGPVRERLLRAAASCFAERGYSGTSVRDITAAAQCNVGAINYYFGGKYQLYVAIFEERFAELTERRVGALRALMDEPDLTVEQVLGTFSDAFLTPLRAGEHGRQTMLLIMREMVEGHLPGSLIADRMIRPTLGALTGAIDRACPGFDREQMQLCCHSLISQLVHALQVQRLHERSGTGALPRVPIEKTVEHIVRFTAAGIRGYLEDEAS